MLGGSVITNATVSDLMSSLTDQEYERYTSLLPTISPEIEDAVQSIQEMSMRILIRCMYSTLEQ